MSDWRRNFTDGQLERFAESKDAAAADYEGMAQQERSLAQEAREELASRRSAEA